MIRVRLAYTKQPEVRFISHLDTVKTFERAIRRGSIPIAYSEGFNPHPKMSFGSALAVGVTSSQEYIDLELKEDIEAADVMNTLNNHLPLGFRITDAREVKIESPALMAVLNVAEYEALLNLTDELKMVELSDKINHYLAREVIEINKETKKSKRNKYKYKEMKAKDIRSGIFSIAGKLIDAKLSLDIRLRTGSTGNIRPEDVVATFVELEELPVDLDSLRIHRAALYISSSDVNLSPLDYS